MQCNSNVGQPSDPPVIYATEGLQGIDIFFLWRTGSKVHVEEKVTCKIETHLATQFDLAYWMMLWHLRKLD